MSNEPMVRPNKRVIVDKKKLFNEAMKPVEVQCFDDIKLLVEKLLENTDNSKISLSTDLTWVDEGKTQSTKVVGESANVSLYNMLLEGIDVIKKQIEANVLIKSQVEQLANEEDDIKLPISNWDVNDVKYSIDELIRRRLGATRQGLRIRWSIQDGIYEFDIYQKKLFKVDK